MTEQQLFELVERVKNIGEDDAEVELENLTAQIREVTAFADVPLPDSVAAWKRAGSKNLLEGMDTAKFKVVSHYDADDEKQDRKRLVTVANAQLALYGFEDELLATQVQSPSDSFLAPYVNLWKSVVWLIDHKEIVWRVLKAVIPRLKAGDKIGLVVALAMFVAAFIVLVVMSMTFASFTASAAHMLKSRDFYCDFLRDKALKQLPSTRYRRSRRAR